VRIWSNPEHSLPSLAMMAVVQRLTHLLVLSTIILFSPMKRPKCPLCLCRVTWDHLIPSIGFSRVHKCDRQTDTVPWYGIICWNRHHYHFQRPLNNCNVHWSYRFRWLNYSAKIERGWGSGIWVGIVQWGLDACISVSIMCKSACQTLGSPEILAPTDSLLA